MNYKRFSRFFCLAAACCVILAGAAAPLTAYAAEDDGSAALDVAQETMTLAAGVYRWNDNLTIPDGWTPGSDAFELPLSFVAPFDIPPELGELPSDPFSFLWVYTFQNSFAIAYGVPSLSVLPYRVYAVAEGRFWNAFASQVSSLVDIDASVLNGYGQTIRILYAQDVPADFGEWFVANTVKQVSPMETFLDNFTAPISGIWSVVTDVSDTIVSTPLLLLAFCFAFLGMCVGIFGRILSRS